VEAVPALLVRTVRMDASSTAVGVVGDVDLASAP
jgi:hypothetical protein